MVYFKKDNLIIRSLQVNDAKSFTDEFQKQGWNKPIEIIQKYYDDQQNSRRQVLVAEIDNNVAGYLTILPKDENGPFKNKNIPVICDFNVLIKYQRTGIGNILMDIAESIVMQTSDSICLGVGLHSGYGPAQRMYVKRGYIPDGSGVWFQDKLATPYTTVENGDDLVLYMSKNFDK